jgi:OFA family oxalate/formate antiporter-like MFS transporter
MVVGLGSIAGGYLGGTLVGHFSPRTCLVAPLFGLAVSLAGLLLPFSGSALLFLMISGLCYGVLISAVPAIVRQSHGDDGFASAFGLIFTAWGVAGLSGPLLGGWAFDWTGSYTAAIVAAAMLSAAAGVLSLVLFSGSEDGRSRLVS